MRSKVLLSVIVCLALMLTFGVAVKSAQADTILFPWVTKGEKISTIISVVNTSGLPLPGVYEVAGVPLQLHYEYWYKATTDINDLTTACVKNDFTRQTSANDIVTFDAAGRIGGGKPLFNDNLLNTPYTNSRFDLGDGVAMNTRAFLLVDNFYAGGDEDDGTLYGEAMVLELNSGAAWGYIAYNPSGTGGGIRAVDFSDGRDLYGEVIQQTSSPRVNPRAEYTPVVLYNPSDAVTKFVVTPIDGGDNWASLGDSCSNDASGPNQRKGNINAMIQLMTAGTSDSEPLVGGMYNNDEEILSFQTPVNVVCTAAVRLSDLIDAGQMVPWTASGRQAWAYLITRAGTIDAAKDGCFDNSEDQAVIGKVEFATTSFQGATVPGVVNNFNWLRNTYTLNSDRGGLNAVGLLLEKTAD